MLLISDGNLPSRMNTFQSNNATARKIETFELSFEYKRLDDALRKF